nr:helix-turn-helix domain-containing protein [Enterococcus rivorum]
MSSRERLTFLKLGVLVIIKKGIFDEELSLSLVNALKIVDHRRTITNTRILSQSKNIEIIDSNCSIRFKEGQIVHLTRLEFQLILELAKEPNKAVSYEELTTLIWSDSVPKGDIYRLANLVFNVRKKLREENIDPSIIKTIRSRGYMLTE